MPDSKEMGVYLIRNTTTGAVYVGSTGVSFMSRWAQHLDMLRHDRHPNRYLQRAWNKYGEGVFRFEIVDVIDDENVREQREVYWLSVFRTAGKCYNLTPVGKLSGHRNVLPEEKQRLREIAIQKHRDPETRTKYLAAIANPELRKKRADAAKERWSRPEFKADIAEKASRVWPGLVSPDGVEYRNIKNLRAFAREHGLHPSAIHLVATGKHQHSEGWTRVDRLETDPKPRAKKRKRT